jgi:hypothetical protein
VLSAALTQMITHGQSGLAAANNNRVDVISLVHAHSWSPKRPPQAVQSGLLLRPVQRTCRFKEVQSSMPEHEASVSKPLQRDSEMFPKRTRNDNA